MANDEQDRDASQDRYQLLCAMIGAGRNVAHAAFAPRGRFWTVSEAPITHLPQQYDMLEQVAAGAQAPRQYVVITNLRAVGHRLFCEPPDVAPGQDPVEAVAEAAAETALEHLLQLQEHLARDGRQLEPPVFLVALPEMIVAYRRMMWDRARMFGESGLDRALSHVAPELATAPERCARAEYLALEHLRELWHERADGPSPLQIESSFLGHTYLLNAVLDTFLADRTTSRAVADLEPGMLDARVYGGCFSYAPTRAAETLMDALAAKDAHDPYLVIVTGPPSSGKWAACREVLHRSGRDIAYNTVDCDIIRALGDSRVYRAAIERIGQWLADEHQAMIFAAFHRLLPRQRTELMRRLGDATSAPRPAPIFLTCADLQPVLDIPTELAVEHIGVELVSLERVPYALFCSRILDLIEALMTTMYQKRVVIEPEAREALFQDATAGRFPGNLQQIEQSLEQVLLSRLRVDADEPEIRVGRADLSLLDYTPPTPERYTARSAEITLPERPNSYQEYKQDRDMLRTQMQEIRLELFERPVLSDVLEQAGGVKARAASQWDCTPQQFSNLVRDAGLTSGRR
ncbi:MAG: hypothetical protein PVH68_13775 [Armatimonadota bacterium]|jgi:hypothetical protein